MADRLTALLVELGFVVTEDDAGVKLGGTAGNLYATLAGTGPGEISTLHPMDTLATLAQRKITEAMARGGWTTWPGRATFANSECS